MRYQIKLSPSNHDVMAPALRLPALVEQNCEQNRRADNWTLGGRGKWKNKQRCSEDGGGYSAGSEREKPCCGSSAIDALTAPELKPAGRARHLHHVDTVLTQVGRARARRTDRIYLTHSLHNPSTHPTNFFKKKFTPCAEMKQVSYCIAEAGASMNAVKIIVDSVSSCN